MTIKPDTPTGPRNKSTRIVSIQKAATYAGVSRWTVSAWISDGKIPFIRYPGRGDADLRGAKVDLNDLDLFIERAKDRNS